MATYAELREQDFKRQIEFNNIKKYHDAGFKGKGITVLNAEHDVDHRKMTSGASKIVPLITLLEVLSGTSGEKCLKLTSAYGERLKEDADRYNIKILVIFRKTPQATIRSET